MSVDLGWGSFLDCLDKKKGGRCGESGLLAHVRGEGGVGHHSGGDKYSCFVVVTLIFLV